MKYITIIYSCLLITGSLYGAENPEMGISDLDVSHLGGRPSDPRLSYHGAMGKKIDNILYDDDTAAQTDINVSIQPADLKPTVVRVRYLSSPWLVTEDDEHYDVRFMPKPTEWTGHGKTGHVVDDDISIFKSRRLEW